MKDLVWIVTDASDGLPILSCRSEESAKYKLFEYMGYKPGVTPETEVIYLGFKEMEYSEFEDNYKGFFSFYSWNPFMKEMEKDSFSLYCLELL